MINILRILKIKVYEFFSFVIRSCYQTDPKIFYGQYFGLHHRGVLFFKNLVNPKRLWLKKIYGRSHLIPSWLKKGLPLPSHSELNEQEIKWFQEFKTNGVLILNQYRPEVADYFLERYGDQLTVAPGSSYFRVVPSVLDPLPMSLLLDESVLKIFGHYLNRQPYVRSHISLETTHPAFENPKSHEYDPKKSGFGTLWHYDTINMVQFHLILEDITPEDTCMLYAQGSHHFNNNSLTDTDAYFSDEYILSKYKLVPCVGKKGTIYLFDPNGIHRLKLKKESQRKLMHINYTPGNSILRELKGQFKLPLSAQAKEMALSPIQKEAIKFVT